MTVKSDTTSISPLLKFGDAKDRVVCGKLVTGQKLNETPEQLDPEEVLFLDGRDGPKVPVT